MLGRKKIVPRTERTTIILAIEFFVNKDGTVITEKVGKSADPDENLDWWEFFTN